MQDNTTTTARPATQGKTTLSYYRPLAVSGGKTYKCAGGGAEDPAHREFYQSYWKNERPAVDGHLWGEGYLPGCLILPGYHGDIITEADARLFCILHG